MPELDTYPAPLDRLHALGIDESQYPAQVDYRALGIGPEHIPALIEIAADRRYDLATVPVVWARIHGWRALGTLRATEAIGPLMALLDRAGDDTWILDEVPRALGSIGAPALAEAARYLADSERSVWGRIAAGTALAEIAQHDPDARGDCVTVLTEQLRHFEEQDDDVNAFLICDLLDLDAVESAAVIEEAFAAHRVDLSINGDWEDVQVELGILPARVTPRPRLWPTVEVERPERVAAPARATRESKAAAKRRRKIAKQSKRRNRRHR